MSGQRGDSIMQGRNSHQGVSSALERLAITPTAMMPSPQPTGHSLLGSAGQPEPQRKTADPSSSPPPRPHKASSVTQQTVDPEPRSEDSVSGLSMHPQQAVDDRGDASLAPPDFDNNSEEARNSLPTPVLQLEKLGSQPPSESSQQHLQDSGSSSMRQASSPPATGEGSSSSGSLPSQANIPNWDPIMPNSNTSEYSSARSSGGEEEEEIDGGTRGGEGQSSRGGEGQCSSSKEGSLLAVVKLRECVQGFVFKTPLDLNQYLSRIVFNVSDFGIYVFDKLNPCCVDGVNVYRPEKEFKIVKIFLPLDHGCGVFLCKDRKSRHMFILKKIMKSNHRLIGTEFLARHRQPFLPQIYGIYKDRNTISIFQEYIEGCTLNGEISWNFAKVRQLMEMLLTAVHYLHLQDLVHFDIKLRNLTVRDKNDPQTLVMIDFESAKSGEGCYIYRQGGYTLHYLPPWHELILTLEEYHPILKTADLWAVACVVIFFLMPVERSNNKGVWGQVYFNIKKDCKDCSKVPQGGSHCYDCKDAFLGHVKEHGHRVLELHLGHLMDFHDDLNWQALKRTLTYLTDTSDVDTKHVEMALRHIKGSQGFYYQAAIEYEDDFDIHR